MNWNELVSRTRDLAAAAQSNDWPAFGAALEARGRCLAALSGGGAAPPTAEQRRELEDMSEQARWLLTARRENLRGDAIGARASRRNVRALQPLEPSIGSRLNREA